MTRILFEKLEVLARELLNFFRKRVEAIPELRRSPMHLEVSQLSLLLRCFRFFPQEVQLPRSGVLLDLSIPILPIPLDNPLPQPSKVFARQGFNFSLYRFNLRHFSACLITARWLRPPVIESPALSRVK
ncbi:MAG TPA: hypothetical protein VF175_17600 [Lacipirellula sp.]